MNIHSASAMATYRYKHVKKQGSGTEGFTQSSSLEMHDSAVDKGHSSSSKSTPKRSGTGQLAKLKGGTGNASATDGNTSGEETQHQHEVWEEEKRRKKRNGAQAWIAAFPSFLSQPNPVHSFGYGWYRIINLSPRNIFCLFICSIVCYIVLVLALLKGNILFANFYISYEVESCLQDAGIEEGARGRNNIDDLRAYLGLPSVDTVFGSYSFAVEQLPMPWSFTRSGRVLSELEEEGFHVGDAPAANANDESSYSGGYMHQIKFRFADNVDEVYERMLSGNDNTI